MFPMPRTEAAVISLRGMALPNPYAEEETSERHLALILSISLLQILRKTHQIIARCSSFIILT